MPLPTSRELLELLESGMVDDTHIGVAFVYPVERIAEAPTQGDKE